MLFRRTSTPHSEADDEKHVTGSGTTILAFDTKTERTVHKGSCIGEYIKVMSNFTNIRFREGAVAKCVYGKTTGCT